MSVILICLHFHDLFSNFRNVLGASVPSLSGGTFVTVRSSDPGYKSLRSHCLVSLSKARNPHCLVLLIIKETIPQCPFLVGFQRSVLVNSIDTDDFTRLVK